MYGSHRAVMANEVVEALRIDPRGLYVDTTFGRGGHSAAVLAQLGETGRLIALDRDPAAVAAGRERFADEPRIKLVQRRFSTVEALLAELDAVGHVDGLIADLGVASPQLDDPARGFSFTREGPLDMRMDPSSGESAAAWLATASEADIRDTLRDFGEERFAGRIARRIVERRRTRPIRSTGELAELVAASLPKTAPRRAGGAGPGAGKHPATRSFQAIRMRVNAELEELSSLLEAIPRVLAPGGRAAIISFHSLEDRMVKQAFRAATRGPEIPRDLPIRGTPHGPLRQIGRFLRPSEGETHENPRARSATLRVVERRREGAWPGQFSP